MKSVLITLFTFLIFSFCWSQPRTNPKKLKAKGNYEHSRTLTQFPEILDDFERQSIFSFDKKNTNIGVTYERQDLEIKQQFQFTFILLVLGRKTD